MGWHLHRPLPLPFSHLASPCLTTDIKSNVAIHSALQAARGNQVWTTRLVCRHPGGRCSWVTSRSFLPSEGTHSLPLPLLACLLPGHTRCSHLATMGEKPRKSLTLLMTWLSCWTSISKPTLSNFHHKKAIISPYTFQPSESVFSYLQPKNKPVCTLHVTFTSNFSDEKLTFSEII